MAVSQYLVTVKVIITPVNNYKEPVEGEQSLTTTRTVSATSLSELGYIYTQVDEIGKKPS